MFLVFLNGLPIFVWKLRVIMSLLTTIVCQSYGNLTQIESRTGNYFNRCHYNIRGNGILSLYFQVCLSILFTLINWRKSYWEVIIIISSSFIKTAFIRPQTRTFPRKKMQKDESIYANTLHIFLLLRKPLAPLHTGPTVRYILCKHHPFRCTLYSRCTV